ncbi:MAG: OmpH family outer membrane protein [Crocinitomicaceae bacterium]
MKKGIITLIAVLFLGAFSATAQKFGHLDYQAVMDTLATYQKAMKLSDDLQTEFESDMKYLEGEYQKKYMELINGADTLPKILIEQKQRELQQLEQLSGEKQQKIQNDLQVINQRYSGPIQDWFDKAVDIVGKRRGLDYIFYYTEEAGNFWINPTKGTDVTNEIITEMIQLEAENPIE